TANLPGPISPRVSDLSVRVLDGRELETHVPRWQEFMRQERRMPLSYDPGWLNILRRGLRHDTYCIEAVEGDATRGLLPLAFVKSLLFGRFLVSLPYLNYGGVCGGDETVAGRLIDSAVQLADDLKVRYLELRQEQAIEHSRLTQCLTTKVHMRLA